jgi:hypothetical protein
MKKLFLLLAIVLCCIKNSYATHLKAGEITYTVDSSNRLFYHFKVAIYTDNVSGKSANQVQGDLVLYFGDELSGKAGTIVNRVNGPEGTSIPGIETSVNYYEISHIFPGNGNYTTRFGIQNRNAGIINLSNSTDISFFIEHTFKVGSTNRKNSIYFGEPPIFQAQLGKRYSQNVTAISPDGDSLSFQLVAPKDISQEGEGKVIPSFIAPEDFRISPVSGEITWTNPKAIGLYVFAVQVSEWRDGIKIGRSTRDYQIAVKDKKEIDQEGHVFTGPNQELTGNRALKTNSSDKLELTVVLNDKNTTSLDWKAISEVFNLPNPAIFTVEKSGVSQIGKFTWTTTAANKRNYPYIITFRGKSTINGQLQESDITTLVYVGVDIPIIPSPANFTATVSAAETTLSNPLALQIYPNPAKDIIHVKVNTTQPKLSFIMIDRFGKEVKRMDKITETDFDVQIGHLANGIYLYRLVNGNKELAQGKLLK